jgi:hypothetical protein
MGKQKPKGHTKSCGKKVKYENWDSADRAARRVGGKWDFMQAYQCKKCKKYHYGHPSFHK